jgi:hypothetical protein
MHDTASTGRIDNAAFRKSRVATNKSCIFSYGCARLPHELVHGGIPSGAKTGLGAALL